MPVMFCRHESNAPGHGFITWAPKKKTRKRLVLPEQETDPDLEGRGTRRFDHYSTKTV
jgi:hypothetical protein